MVNLKPKKTDLELAQEHERKAKELRLKIRKERENDQRKHSEGIGRIVGGIIGRDFVEEDVETSRHYADSIATHIKKAMSSTPTTSPAHTPDEPVLATPVSFSSE